ncbi:protein FAM227B-like isoform X3 [Paramacrobiotus metropolitanus]|nr:protein FAM227B-like isoform X3 [Paramacrobiotus metropolitanus]
MATGVSEILRKLQDMEMETIPPVLPEASYVSCFLESKTGLSRFMEPLKELLQKGREAERLIKGMLGKFSLSTKGSLFETGIHKVEMQNGLIITSLLSKYSAQVARRRMERRRLTDEVLAYDNDAIMNVKDPSTAMQIHSHENSDLVENLPHPDQYDQPTKAELIRKMIHRTFMGLPIASVAAKDFKLPYNVNDKAVLQKVTNLQPSDNGIFSSFSWQVAFHSRCSREILVCAWWWIFLYYFRTEDENNRASKLCLLLRRLGKSYRNLYKTITANFRDRVLERFPDCMSQAIFIIFNEVFPFQRVKFVQPEFLTSMETHLHRWFMGGNGAASEHYRFRWLEWRFQYMDLNKIHDPLCYPQFFDLKLKTDPIPQACDVLGTEKVVLEIPKFKADLMKIIRKDNQQKRDMVKLKLPTPGKNAKADMPVVTSANDNNERTPIIPYVLESDCVPGYHVQFETAPVEINHQVTPLLSAELPLYGKPIRFRTKTNITRIKRKLISPFTFADVVRDVQNRIRHRRIQVKRHANALETENKKKKRSFWTVSHESGLLKEYITVQKVKRKNLGELRLEIMAAQDIERHLPGVMRRKLRKGHLPPLLGFKTTKEIITGHQRNNSNFETFLGSFFDSEKKTKLTEWDKMNVP